MDIIRELVRVSAVSWLCRYVDVCIYIHFIEFENIYIYINFFISQNIYVVLNESLKKNIYIITYI